VYANACYLLLEVEWAGKGHGAGLEIIVHDVYIHCFSTVTPVSAPVVDNIVAEIRTLVKLRSRARSKPWGAAGVMSKQVVMIGCAGPTPNGTISVCTLGMAGVGK
jgi:deoxycytidylate deaminase